MLIKIQPPLIAALTVSRRFWGPELFAHSELPFGAHGPFHSISFEPTFNIQPRMSWQGAIKHKTQRKKLRRGGGGWRARGKGRRKSKAAKKNYAPDAAEF